MTSPRSDWLYPGDFLPLVEGAGPMHEMTIVVLAHALDQARSWQLAGRAIPVAVNLSPSSLVDVELPRRVEQMLTERGLTPHCSPWRSPRTPSWVTANERDGSWNGCAQSAYVSWWTTSGPAISRWHLRDFPIDALKLDRSFIATMAVDDRALAIAQLDPLAGGQASPVRADPGALTGD